MSSSLVGVDEVETGIIRLTLQNQRRRNALSQRVLEELERTLLAIRERTDVHVVILAAQGPVFSSGHDLNELVDGEEAAYARLFETCGRVMLGIDSLPQPVIAEVDGLATAAGCQLVATCDLAVATEESQFATPGVKIGLFCTTPGVALARAIGPRRALAMLLLGEPIDAREALQAGLIHRIVSRHELRDASLAIARSIANASSPVLALGKRAFKRQIGMGLPEAYRFAERVMVDNALMPDGQEGMKAFLKKRSPRWTGDPSS